MNTRSTGMLLIAAPPCRPMYSSARVEHHFTIKDRVGVAVQVAPGFHRLVPQLARGRHGASADVVQSDIVDSHHAHARAGLDGHIAQGHAPFHAQVFHCLSGELDGVTGTPGGADLADDGQRQVLRGDTGGQAAVDAHAEILHLLLHQALGGEHMLDLGGANAVGESAQGTVGAGVGVAADHGHAGQRGTLLRSHDMHDALTAIVDRDLVDTESVAVLIQGLHLQTRYGIDDAGDTTGALRLLRGHVVIGHGQDAREPPGLTPRQAQTLEGLGRGDFVNQVAIDVNQGGTVLALLHEMVVPEFVVECAARHGELPCEFGPQG